MVDSLQPGFKAFGHGYRAALIEINGSRNFRHIRQEADEAKEAAHTRRKPVSLDRPPRASFQRAFRA